MLDILQNLHLRSLRRVIDRKDYDYQLSSSTGCFYGLFREEGLRILASFQKYMYMVSLIQFLRSLLHGEPETYSHLLFLSWKDNKLIRKQQKEVDGTLEQAFPSAFD